MLIRSIDDPKNLYTLESNTQPNSDENDVDDKEVYNISDVNKNKIK